MHHLDEARRLTEMAYHTDLPIKRAALLTEANNLLLWHLIENADGLNPLWAKRTENWWQRLKRFSLLGPTLPDENGNDEPPEHY